MAQYLSPDNWASRVIGARPGSTVVAMADGHSRMPDDAVSELATVALTSSMVLKGTRGCTLTLGMSLFGASLSWPPKAPPWPSATARTKLHVAHPLARHYEEEEEEEEEEERQVDDGGFCCVTEGDQRGYVPPTLTMFLTTTTNKEEDATLAHTAVEEGELIADRLI